MITKYMELTTRDDARQWASEYGLSTESEIENLARWIWKNKGPSRTIEDHPLNSLTEEEFWNIISGK